MKNKMAMAKKKEVSRRKDARSALHEMMRDMIQWEFGGQFGERSLLDVIRKKYVVKIR